jgi:nucleoside-diphosphate-sugar epimerase
MIDLLSVNRGQGLLLLTGASGLVGSGLVPLLRAFDPTRTVVALSRRPDALTDLAGGVLTFRADLRLDGLGLDNVSYRLLRNRVTEIIHCAAEVRFNETLESSRATNTEGTRRLLDFAEGCPKLTKFAHISTLYIAGKRPGLVSERALQHDCGYFNVYEQSKHEAERLVFERMHRLPLSIYRLSAIIGNSITGRVSQKNFFHALIALAPRVSALPCLPIDPTAPVDLIADDWCFHALALLYQYHFNSGSVHHVCAGQEHSLTAQELIHAVFDAIEKQIGRRIVVPPQGTWKDVERHRQSFSSANEGALLDLVSKFLPHLALSQPFERGPSGDLLDQHSLTPPQATTFVQRVIYRCLATTGSAALGGNVDFTGDLDAADNGYRP